MPSPEIIRRNLAVLHAEQGRRARWLWGVLAACVIVGIIAAFHTLF